LPVLVSAAARPVIVLLNLPQAYARLAGTAPLVAQEFGIAGPVVLTHQAPVAASRNVASGETSFQISPAVKLASIVARLAKTVYVPTGVAVSSFVVRDKKCNANLSSARFRWPGTVCRSAL
jgi:hypothetical protein